MTQLSTINILHKLPEKITSISATTATTNIDFSNGSLFNLTLGADTTISFTGISQLTNNSSFTTTIFVKNDATAGRTITWPIGIKWTGGIIPPKTTTANAIDIWTFFTIDAGITWYGNLAMKDAK